MSGSDQDHAAHRPTRRGFLKRAAAGAAALSVARAAHAAGTDVIRVGMIGCGGRGTDAGGQALLAGRDVRLVAMADVFRDRLESSREKLAARFPEQVAVDEDHRFIGLDGYRHVIESCDVVLIACASKFHPMYAEEAVRAGRHVFVEKPHGIDPAGVRRMKAACDLAAERKLSVVSGLHSRFDAGYRETIRRIHDGAIGEIVAVQCLFLRAPYAVVLPDPAWSEMEYQFRNWYHFCWLSGDDVSQSLVHNLDRASWVLREEQPVWAFGLGGRAASFGRPFGDMFDNHTVVYEYAGGRRLYAMCRTQGETYHSYTDVIMGTRGICHLFDMRIEGENPWKYEGQVPDPREAEQRALIESVRQGRPINSGYHMCDSTMIAVLGQIACYSGKYTTLKECWESDFMFGPAPEAVRMDMAPPVLPDETGNYPLPRPGITRLPLKPPTATANA